MFKIYKLVLTNRIYYTTWFLMLQVSEQFSQYISSIPVTVHANVGKLSCALSHSNLKPGGILFCPSRINLK